MNRHYVILSTLCLFLLFGCATKPSRQHHTKVSKKLNKADKAKVFSRNGQHKQAARLYRTLADTKPGYRDVYNLLAAEAFVQSGDSDAAKSLLKRIKPVLLEAGRRNKYYLIAAQANLAQGETEKALGTLGTINTSSLKPADQIIFFQSSAFAHSLSGNLIKSAESRIQLTPLLASEHQRDENNTVILNTLTLLPSQDLINQQATATDTLAGWMSLAELLRYKKLNQEPAGFQLALFEWQQLFPQHPANEGSFIQKYSEGAENTFTRATSLALLLPESGRFSRAAESIKVGFMAAYQLANPSSQPSIRFYDTSAADSVDLYYQAVEEGAELVIGPLAKGNIQQLALGAEISIPILALNHIPNLVKDDLFQFGLSPIDEAKQIATDAASRGARKVLILTPETRQGHRVADYLTEYWQETGGMVLESEYYNNRESDFSKPIKNLLNLDESQYRYKKLSQILSRNIEYTERRRADVDAIFISASAQKARSLYPQLQFYRATRVPVYAPPQVYAGVRNPSADIDLNGISFCDIPWLFSELYPGELSQETLREGWQHLPAKYIRLVALGIDAFNLTESLGQIATIPFAGATGTLSLDMGNRITRQLVCAKFIDGYPVLQETVYFEPENNFDSHGFFQ